MKKCIIVINTQAKGVPGTMMLDNPITNDLGEWEEYRKMAQKHLTGTDRKYALLMADLAIERIKKGGTWDGFPVKLSK